jgi:hypothetical protein
MEPKMATPEDQAWLEEFNRGAVRPQPIIHPTVREAAETRLRQIDREIKKLQAERKHVERRLM